jgi:hypothetical protein
MRAITRVVLDVSGCCNCQSYVKENVMSSATTGKDILFYKLLSEAYIFTKIILATLEFLCVDLDDGMVLIRTL